MVLISEARRVANFPVEWVPEIFGWAIFRGCPRQIAGFSLGTLTGASDLKFSPKRQCQSQPNKTALTNDIIIVVRPARRNGRRSPGYPGLRTD